jgi:hypothetical protein
MASRITSQATTITVAAPSMALRSAIAGMRNNSFVEFNQGSLWSRTPDPRGSAPDFYPANPTEDGANNVGHTMIDYGGKWCWDPVTRRGMWAGNGANPAGRSVRIYSHLYNVHSVYEEGTNSWTATRGIKGPNEGADPDCIVHVLHNNAIDVVGRRFYKKKFRTDEIMVYDLDNRQWLNTMPGPGALEASYARDGAMEVVPTRGSKGALWVLATSKSSDHSRLVEYDLASGGPWTLLKDSPNFGTQKSGTSCMSFNPRAFGGAGGVLCGNNSGTFAIRVDTLAVTPAGTPPQVMVAPNGAHLAADPAGQGWYYVASDGYLYANDGASWRRVIQMPSDLKTPGHTHPVVVCPLHRDSSGNYGVLWIVAGQMPSHGATNGVCGWLYKP